jgi:hypothetical protein
MPAEKKYPHRVNLDGSWDSICPRCYLTIANRKTERELAAFEKTHVCHESAFLAERGYFYTYSDQKAS